MVVLMQTPPEGVLVRLACGQCMRRGAGQWERLGRWRIDVAGRRSLSAKPSRLFIRRTTTLSSRTTPVRSSTCSVSNAYADRLALDRHPRGQRLATLLETINVEVETPTCGLGLQIDVGEVHHSAIRTANWWIRTRRLGRRMPRQTRSRARRANLLGRETHRADLRMVTPPADLDVVHFGCTA